MDTPSTYKIIGLMSGTSGDGLDIAYCEFKKSTRWTYTISKATTVPFPEKLGQQLQLSHTLSGEKLALLDIEFGEWMGKRVREFALKNKLQVDAVASHGHTVFHQPAHKITMQIGNGWALHRASRFKVINDFRMLDVQLGGQGAPLVPIGDKYLFGEVDYCINLGGIANLSTESVGMRIAFDICPFNLLLNHFAQKTGIPYDDGGEFARRGKLISSLYEKLNHLPFYKIEGFKSLGREDLAVYFEIFDLFPEVTEVDFLHTLVKHYVYQLTKSMKQQSDKISKVLITGGGAFNTFFIENLADSLGDRFKIIEAGQTVINFKEAMIFAFLGVLRLRGEVNVLSSVTGAERDSVSGMVFGL